MPPNDSIYPKDWFRLSARDWKRAEQLLNLEDPEGAGYHLQQAVEKYVKGFLLSKGWKLKRIHDLEILLNDALKYESSLEKYRSLCQKITGYYFFDRYPLPLAATWTREEVQESIVEAEQLIQRLKGATK